MFTYTTPDFVPTAIPMGIPQNVVPQSLPLIGSFFPQTTAAFGSCANGTLPVYHGGLTGCDPRLSGLTTLGLNVHPVVQNALVREAILRDAILNNAWTSTWQNPWAHHIARTNCIPQSFYANPTTGFGTCPQTAFVA